MWSLELGKMFSASKFATGKAPSTRPKKSVSFDPDTNFSPGRGKCHFMRGSSKYLVGKHACPQGFGEWLDTSMMYDDFEQLLDLKVHATFRVRDVKEAAALQNAFQTQMNAGNPLIASPRTPILLRHHPLCEKISNIFASMQTEKNRGDSNAVDDEWRMAKALILYTTHEGAFVSLQFVNDMEEERDTDGYIEELKRTVPAKNIGISRFVQLRMLQET